VFLLSFALYAVATIVLFLVRSQHAQKPSTAQETRFNKNSAHVRSIILLSVFFALVFFFINLVRPLVVQFFQDVYALDQLSIGMLGSFVFLGSAIFSVLLGKAGDKLGRAVAIVVALLVGSLSFGLFLCFNNMFALGIASFLNGASYMLWSLMGASVGSIAPETSRGRWISLAQMSATLAATAAPYIGGVLYEGSYNLPFYIVIAALPILSLLALAKPFREKHARKEASS
jgi:MFS family permease